MGAKNWSTMSQKMDSCICSKVIGRFGRNVSLAALRDAAFELLQHSPMDVSVACAFLHDRSPWVKLGYPQKGIVYHALKMIIA